MIVLSMTIVIVMFWRWRCFFFGWVMHVLLSLTIRFPYRDVIAAAKKHGLLQPRPTCVAPATDKLTTVAALIYSVV